MIGSLQLVSGIFLLIAVFKIRSFLVNSGMKNAMDQKSMTVHAVSFILYSFAVVILYVIYFVYRAMPDDVSSERRHSITRDCLIAWIITCYTNLVAQACLIWIFLKFRSKEKVVMTEI